MILKIKASNRNRCIVCSVTTPYGYVKIQNCIKKADLTSKYSPRDLIEQFRKVYIMDLDGQMILTEVPKKIEEMEKKLNLNLFPK